MIRKQIPLIGFISFALLLVVAHFSSAQTDRCGEDTAISKNCISVVALGSDKTRQYAEDASDPANPYALIVKEGPTVAGAGDSVVYRIDLANYEAITRTMQMTETLPDNLQLIPASLSDGLVYDSNQRQLTWQGEMAPAHLSYHRLPDGLTIPYLDLADYGIPNLCLDLPDCDETAVTFNLGINNRHFSYYGRMLSELTVSPNGIITADTLADTRTNQWLPASDLQTAVLAGLWRDIDMRLALLPEEGTVITTGGRWHVALLTGLLPGHDLFYAQWHDAAAASDPDTTTRHALALALGEGAYTGHIFMIYDNIAHPDQVVDAGYTIGLSDTTGSRGLTVAFADCCGGRPPQGYPPAAGTTLHFSPRLLHPENEKTTLSYRAIVEANVSETVVTTAIASTDSPNPDNQFVWSTHTLFVRDLVYLPVIQRGGH